MSGKRKKEPLYKQIWFLMIVGLILGFCYFAYQSGFFADVWMRLLGPSPAQQAEERALYDQAMQDLEEALRTGDTSILEQRWCGQALEKAKEMVLEGDMQRQRVLKVDYGLPFAEPRMSVDEVWIKGATEISRTNKVRLGDGCIIEFYPTDIPSW